MNKGKQTLPAIWPQTAQKELYPVQYQMVNFVLKSELQFVATNVVSVTYFIGIVDIDPEENVIWNIGIVSGSFIKLENTKPFK